MTVSEEAGVRFVEGPAGLPLMRKTDDATLVVEACFSNRAMLALLYPSNLTERFFDLSSGEAGAILQKLRNYRVRVALVCPADSVKFSRMFPEMAAEEARVGYFRIFESVKEAREWLSEQI